MNIETLRAIFLYYIAISSSGVNMPRERQKMTRHGIAFLLRIILLPEDFIALFKKNVEAPMRIDPTPGETTRADAQEGHTNRRYFLYSEIVLLSMDVAVNHHSGMTLIRFYDYLLLDSEPSETANTWETIKTFVKVLWLDINTSKTGSVYLSNTSKDSNLAIKFPKGPVCMGVLKLSDAGDRTIDQDQVAAHTRQL